MSRSSSHEMLKTSAQGVERRLALYSLTAAAAGVSLLALAQPAEGEVVITKKTIPIPVSQFGFTPHPVYIDLNRDGINDFSFYLYSFAYHSFHQNLTITALQGGAVVGAPGGRGLPYVSALMRGAKIGPSAHFSSQHFEDIELAGGFDASSNYSRHLYGNWGGNPKNRYVGVRFLIDGETHYGWIRMTVITQPRGMTATITAYAYETEANKRILAGVDETVASVQEEQRIEKATAPSLGMLALGADGLALWKRDEPSSSSAVQ